MKKYKVAIVGATGAVGREMLRCIFQFNFPFESIKLLASARSAGNVVEFEGHEFVVEELTENSFEGVEVAFWSAGGSISEKYMPYAVQAGCVNIDNTSHFRMDPEVPLVVPEVNPEDLKNHNGIIANPNCSTIQAMIPLKVLLDNYGIKRIVYSTYQAVSGAGMQGIQDLEDGLKGIAPKKFPYPIAGNCLPHIDVFLDNGYTKEEIKMIEETKKILHSDDIKITATTVRVPVLNSHSESLNVELNSEFDINDIFKLFENTDGLTVYDNITSLKYPTALDVSGKDDVYVGRIRRDFSLDNGLNLWVVADNIRKGAALNAVQIAEVLIKNEWL